jgi:cytochrome P450
MSITQVRDVDPSLVVDYDHIHGLEIMVFPPSAIDRFREERPIFFSPRYGGFWVLTRHADIRGVLQDAETFQQHADGLPRNPYNKIHIPLMLNPPEHTKFRRVMAPIFSPRMVAKLEPIVRDVIRKQVATIKPLGRCDFVSDLCMAPPTAMYCAMLGVDPGDFSEFNQISEDLIFGAADILLRDGEAAARAFREKTSNTIDDILIPILDDRRRNRGDDILSILLDAEVDGQKLSDDEMLNIASLLFFAGTDSTAAILSYAFLFLAQSPTHRQQLIDHPEMASDATQELIRYNGFHQIRRVAARDTELLGNLIRKGDIIVLPMQSANHDPRKFPDPLLVDFNRENAGGAITFSAGPHRCIGQHLASLQLRMALEEVHKVITDYQLDLDLPYEYMTSHAKTVLRHLPMVYSPN